MNDCIGAPNSAGPGARIAYCGPASVSFNDASLSVTGLVPNSFGLLYYGPEALQIPFGHGFRCVGPGSIGVTRLEPPQVSGAAGTITRAIDFTQPPMNAGPGTIAPGISMRFQYWYRDVPAGAPFFNLSDAVEVLFCP